MKFSKFKKFTKFMKFTKCLQLTKFTRLKKFMKFMTFMKFTKFTKILEFMKLMKFIKFMQSTKCMRVVLKKIILDGSWSRINPNFKQTQKFVDLGGLRITRPWGTWNNPASGDPPPLAILNTAAAAKSFYNILYVIMFTINVILFCWICLILILIFDHKRGILLTAVIRAEAPWSMRS